MASMKTCPNCGRESYAFVAKCIDCGYVFPVEDNGVRYYGIEEKKAPEDFLFPLLSLIFGILGMLCSCVVIGIVPAVAGLILGIIALSKETDKKGLAISGIVCSSLAFILFCVFLLAVGTEQSSTNDKEPVSVVSENETYIDDDVKSENEYEMKDQETVGKEEQLLSQNDTVEEVIEEKEEVKTYEGKEEFIALCEKVPYKTLARDPEAYIGTKLELTVKVQQVMQGGFFDDSQYYRVNTDDEYGMWFGDEYFMYDFRVDDDMKILQEDIIKVYAEFAGVEQVTRALTGTTEEVPAIKAIYVELVEETEAAGVSEEVLNDGTIDIDYEDFSIQYDSYDYTINSGGEPCVIIYYYFTNNDSEPQSAGSSVYLKVFQNGIECDSSYGIRDNQYVDNKHKEVLTGTTIKVGEAFKVSSKDELLLEVTDYLSFEEVKDTMTLDIN